MVKKILSILLWVATATGLIFLFIFARENYLDRPLNGVNLLPATDSGFVRRSELQKELEESYGLSKVGTIDMRKIQKLLNDIPWIENNTAYVDLDGKLNVSFKEYEPRFRYFDNKGRSMYVTDEGVIIPSCSNYTPYVLVASGRFEIKNDSVTYKLTDTLTEDRAVLNALHWIKAIEDNPFIANCIGQLYYHGNNDFGVTVKGLNAQIIVGDTCLAKDKLNRLEIFMKQRINKPETQSLEIINLKYKNQIVCTKR